MIQSKGIEILKAEADWCGGCKAINPLIKDLEKTYNKQVITFDVESNQTYAIETLKVKNLPTVIVFNNGEEVERLVGRKTKQEYEQVFEKYT